MTAVINELSSAQYVQFEYTPPRTFSILRSFADYFLILF